MNQGNVDEARLTAAPASTEEEPLPRERRAARVKRRDEVHATIDVAPARGARPEPARDRSEREVFDAFFHGAMLARRRLGYAPATWSTNARSEAQ
jgi:hypothetical protein